MNSHKYYYLREKIDPRAATVDRLGDYVGNIRAVRKGERIGSKDTINVPISKDDGDLLLDLIGNVSNALIISEKVLTVLSEAGVLSSDVEIVPLRILDKQGNPIPKKYSIINPLRTINCLDITNSDAEVFEDEVLSLYMIQIYRDKIPNDALMFRIGEFPSYILIRDDLLQVLQANDLQGLRAVAMGEEVYE